jgi:S1-C subfamily serine protease
MLRTLAIATLLLIVPPAATGQPVSVLHIKVVLLDAERKPTPVPRHALLISDNPPTTTPRRTVTGLDGTADVRLRPGNYTIESDEPVAFQGKAYQWTKTLDVVSGRDTVLELTTANAEIVPITSVKPPSAAPIEADLPALLNRWQDSVVALWTPTTHASGFVIDGNGLVATSQRAIGTATSIEVQLSATVKVAGTVLAADSTRDVAVLRIDPKIAASVAAVPLACGQPPKALTAGQEIFTIGAPMVQQKGPAFGVVKSLEAHAIVSDFRLPSGSAGGPVFTSAGDVIGVTSIDDEKTGRNRESSRIVRVEDVCEAVASAAKKTPDAAPPSAALLPVEPVAPFPEDLLKEAARRRVGSLNPYLVTSSDFDIGFMTPVQTYDRQLDFSNWSEYVAAVPPVLLVRVTPRMVESFWTKVARGAASTQGVALPPIKRLRPGFLRMRAFCGDAEVTPIHPFRLEQRVSETEGIFEGLYVFDPGALTPSCESVKLLLFSEKEPTKSETRVVDPKILQQIYQDFAPYRGVK